ncbi:hypothetical protein [Nostoc sp. CALU 1950]|uniref:hypothetical protein n=1 Tax=Nostoc sp. CALU 1950 TaxID=3104321 RepID=UPI003EC0228B
MLTVNSENELELTADVLVIGGGSAAAWAAWAGDWGLGSEFLFSTFKHFLT